MSLWVKINDRLPENNQRVLAFIPKKTKYFFQESNWIWKLEKLSFYISEKISMQKMMIKKRSMEFIFGLEKEIAITSFKT
jgi:hypothetical protein